MLFGIHMLQMLEKAKIKLEVKKGTRLPPGRFLTVKL